MDRTFDAYVSLWNLTPDGDAIVTHGSRLLPVRRDGVAAMLKIALAEEEKAGAALMPWWRGRGAARVLAHAGDALLLERAEDARSLRDMARSGSDDEATRILCAVIAELHASREEPAPKLVALEQWFAPLERGAARHGGVLTVCAGAARELLSTPQDVVVLHGDVHHANVLDFGARGWLAIDPKGLRGERGFEYANLFCNPERDIAVAPGRLARRLGIVAAAARLERKRLLRWMLAYAGLSAVWAFDDGMVRDIDLTIAEAVAAELTRPG